MWTIRPNVQRKADEDSEHRAAARVSKRMRQAEVNHRKARQRDRQPNHAERCRANG